LMTDMEGVVVPGFISSLIVWQACHPPRFYPELWLTIRKPSRYSLGIPLARISFMDILGAPEAFAVGVHPRETILPVSWGMTCFVIG
jgi:hypothetical protein